jgi:hypothetical protein
MAFIVELDYVVNPYGDKNRRTGLQTSTTSSRSRLPVAAVSRGMLQRSGAAQAEGHAVSDQGSRDASRSSGSDVWGQDVDARLVWPEIERSIDHVWI